MAAEVLASPSRLFLNEGDALSGRRGDAGDGPDRYANIENSCLSQRMKTCDGWTAGHREPAEDGRNPRTFGALTVRLYRSAPPGV